MLRTSILLAFAVACDDPAAEKDTADAGVGDPSSDVDRDGYTLAEGDCDDDDAAVNPGAVEVCDGADQDCDDEVDEGLASRWFTDADGDTYGDDTTARDGCEAGTGEVATGGDCDDADGGIHPAAVEVCDGVDQDCDGEIDDGVSFIAWLDGDGDGAGDAATAAPVCALTGAWVDNAADCDDTDADAFPGNPEVCDLADNDCDGTVDDGVTTSWYADVDADGYGDADVVLEACALPTGYAASADDCDDLEAAVHPDAAETCDGIDQDCDGAIDEDAVDALSWYADSDTDGHGDATAVLAACDAPAGMVAAGDDCDDTDAAVSPDAAEACNGVDDDCDGTLDEADATDASTWYYDYDLDGFGGTRLSETACTPSAGYVADGSDCDDGDEDIFPGATELCNGEDDDCDSVVDEADATDVGTWYADADGDGYGDPASTSVGCDAPAGTVGNDDDCDDTDADVSPADAELCNGVDDDCDAEVDEASAADAATWYADADADGLGDPAVTTLACDQPADHVANDDDCDDSSARDLDGDGLQDCEDADMDGDGLRDDWDADPEDDTVHRGPTSGFGGDGALTVSSSTTWSDWSLLDTAAAAGATSLTVDDVTPFAEGDEVLVLSQQGTDAGQYQFVFVAGVSGSTLTVEPPLDDAYSGSSVVLVQRVPHYTTLSVAAGVTLTADAWAGAGGAVLVVRATDTLTVAGTITTSSLGFRGGSGIAGCCSTYPTQGESTTGTGSYSASANLGGGGTYTMTADGGESGGGGAYGTDGDDGTHYTGSVLGNGGGSYGVAALTSWFLGSGGGGGSPDTESDGRGSGNVTGDGGDGGGLVALYAGTTLSVSGSVLASGSDGEDGVSDGGEVGGGGAGAGGTVLLAAPTVAISGTVAATGGTGGSSAWHDGSPYGSAYGGDGGDGRIRIETDGLTGTTSPTAGSTAVYTE